MNTSNKGLKQWEIKKKARVNKVKSMTCATCFLQLFGARSEILTNTLFIIAFESVDYEYIHEHHQ